ncbi:MAG TPA: hypothetical protein VK623_10695 [Flavobacterium sp.]|nr:hypothetical protein [Flavobacterium sp.]
MKKFTFKKTAQSFSIVFTLLVLAYLSLKFAFNPAPPVCSDYIVIKLTSAGIPPTWETDNQPYLAAQQPSDQNYKNIDANILKCKDATLAFYAGWLKTNQSYIDEKRTTPYIECAHSITSPEDTSDADNAAVFAKLDLSELKRRMKAAGGDFDKDLYDHYVVFEEDGSDVKITFNPNPHTINDNSYSIPLLRAIATNHQLGPDTDFEFRVIYDKCHNKKVIFNIVEHNLGAIIRRFFNFSQDPSFCPRTKTSRL